MTTPTLWHFTCDHGRAAIGDAGELLPASLLSKAIPDLWWPGRLVWMTDLAVPDRYYLGLTSVHLKCDRMAHRYRVTDPDHCRPWAWARRPFRRQAYLIETPGSRPMHWWVSGEPVPVEYAPRESPFQ